MAEVKPDKSDRKRVTLREVAQEAGVSLKTASNVINHSGRMADATREKVQDVIDRLGYRVNVSARIYGYSVYITTYAEGSAQGARALLRNFNATVSDGMILSISEVEDLDPEDLDVDYPLVCVGARSTHGKADHVTPDEPIRSISSSCATPWKATRSCACEAYSKRVPTKASNWTHG